MSIARSCPYDEEKEFCKYETYRGQPRFDKCPTCSRAKNVMMNIKLIKTESDYLSALKRIDELFDSEPNTPEGDELELLITLVELYEKNNFPIESPSPIEGDCNEMDFKKAFKSIFGFDIFDFDAAYENSQIGTMLDSLEKAREVKSAYEFLKEKFGWKGSFSIYKYNDACGKGVPGYAVENDSLFEIPEIEKVE